MFHLNSYQEGLKTSKALQEKRREEETSVEKLLELKNKDEESGNKINKSRYTASPIHAIIWQD